MKTRVSIVGATGYSGAELTAALARHRFAKIAGLYSGASSTVTQFADIHPSLRKATGPAAKPFSMEGLLSDQADIVFLAIPNELSAEIAPAIIGAGAKVIDLSGSHRLKRAEQYPPYYGFDHPAPHLLDQAVYGLTEWCNGELFDAQLVANPGCYATSILLALLPIRDLIEPGHQIVCDAKSGTSGAGKKADAAFSLTELAGDFKAYSVRNHRHVPEIAQQLGLNVESIRFVPHLLPIPRGILSTIYLRFSRRVSDPDLSERFQNVYHAADFVHVHPEGSHPSIRDVAGTPRCEIGYSILDDGWSAVVVSVIDNLLKGAASQAVQNFNRVSGFDEREGLS